MSSQKNIVNGFLIIAAVYTLGWYGLSQYAEERVLANIEALEATDYVKKIEYEEITFSGYPFELSVDILNPRIVVDSGKLGKDAFAKGMNLYTGVEMFTGDMFDDNENYQSNEDLHVYGLLKVKPNFKFTEYAIERKGESHLRTEKFGKTYYIVAEGDDETVLKFERSSLKEDASIFLGLKEESERDPINRLVGISMRGKGERVLNGINRQKLYTEGSRSLDIGIEYQEDNRVVFDVKIENRDLEWQEEANRLMQDMSAAMGIERTADLFDVGGSGKGSSKGHFRLGMSSDARKLVMFSEAIDFEIVEYWLDDEINTISAEGTAGYNPPKDEEGGHELKVAMDSTATIKKAMQDYIIDKYLKEFEKGALENEELGRIVDHVKGLKEEQRRSLVPAMHEWGEMKSRLAFDASFKLPTYVRIDNIDYDITAGEHRFKVDGDIDYYQGFDKMNGAFNVLGTKYGVLVDSVASYINNAVEVMKPMLDDVDLKGFHVSPEFVADIKAFLQALSNKPTEAHSDFNTTIEFGFSKDQDGIMIGTVKGEEAFEALVDKHITKHFESEEEGVEEIIEE